MTVPESEGEMPLAKRRLEWLQSITGETTERGIARRIGRSHTTVGRWVSDGIPLEAVFELSRMLSTDPYAALEALGMVSDAADVPQKMPLTEVPTVRLTEEVHNRATKGLC